VKLPDSHGVLYLVSIVKYLGLERALLEEDLLHAALGPLHQVARWTTSKAPRVVGPSKLHPERRGSDYAELGVEHKARQDGAVAEAAVRRQQTVGDDGPVRVADVHDLFRRVRTKGRRARLLRRLDQLSAPCEDCEPLRNPYFYWFLYDVICVRPGRTARA
jgi:hypothetical protein